MGAKSISVLVLVLVFMRMEIITGGCKVQSRYVQILKYKVSTAYPYGDYYRWVSSLCAKCISRYGQSVLVCSKFKFQNEHRLYGFTWSVKLSMSCCQKMHSFKL